MFVGGLSPAFHSFYCTNCAINDCVELLRFRLSQLKRQSRTCKRSQFESRLTCYFYHYHSPCTISVCFLIQSFSCAQSPRSHGDEEIQMIKSSHLKNRSGMELLDGCNFYPFHTSSLTIPPQVNTLSTRVTHASNI